MLITPYLQVFLQYRGNHEAYFIHTYRYVPLLNNVLGFHLDSSNRKGIFELVIKNEL